jgi:spore coat polysaccharide biosynthesis protein SpsF
MRVVAIIQARTGSTRLPGKVLKDLGGVTMLGRVANRARRATTLHGVVVATSVEADDDAVVAECARLNVPTARGSESDVLERYYVAAMQHKADTVVRLTSDCPLIDPDIIDEIVGVFLGEQPDYATNTLERTYPRGQDVEVLSIEALARAWREASEPYQREHVTPYLYQNPGLFRLRSVTAADDTSMYRWTVDTEADLALVRAIYARLGNRDTFGWRDVLGILASEPDLASLNSHVMQKELHEG